MKINNHIYQILILIQLSLLGCKTVQETQIIGEYKYDGSTLTLEPNKIFEFDWQAGLISTKIHGTYEVQGKNLYLTAIQNPNRKDFKIQIPPQTKRSDFELMIRDENWNRIIGATCELTKKGELIKGTVTNNVGICELPYSKTGYINIRSLGNETAEINLDSIFVHSLIVELKEEDYHEYFENRKMLIKKGKIIDKNSKPKWEFTKSKTR